MTLPDDGFVRFEGTRSPTTGSPAAFTLMSLVHSICCRVALGACLGALLTHPAMAADADTDALPVVERIFPQVESLVRGALEQSPRMIARNLDLLQAEESIGVYNARLLPRFDTSFQFNQQQDDRANLAGTVSSQKLTYDVRISQPLFHWGALRAGARVGTIQAEIAANNVAEAYRLLALEIRSSYLNLVLLKLVVHNMTYEAGLARKRLATAEARVRAGEVPAGAVDPAKAAIEDVDLQLLRATHNFDVAVRNFRRLSGSVTFDASSVPDAMPAVVQAPVEQTQPFRVNYVERGEFQRSNRFHLVQLELQRERLNEKVLRVNLRPKVDLVAGLFQDELSYTLDVSRKDQISSTYVGVRVGWNVFDGFMTRSSLRALRTRQRQLENQLAELGVDLVNAAADAAKDLEFAGRALVFAERGLVQTEAGFGYVKDNLSKGRASQADVDAAQAGVNNSRYHTYASRISYLNSLATYLSQVNADPIVTEATRKLLQR